MIEELPNILKKIIVQGENIHVEFKEAKKGLPSNLFESICSMLNRNGGHIFLGIKDDGDVVGVDKDYITKMKIEFVNLCNNPQKIFPTIHLDIKEYMYLGKIILYIFVNESSDVHNTNNRIYDRNEDGDYEITNSTSLVSNMYIRKKNTYIENKIYPFATMDDLREDLIDKARIMAVNRINTHPWKEMSNEELLKSAGLYEKNPETGEFGFNLACILIFGKDETIKSALSYYKTDAILRVENLDRYDDRDDIRTNLIDSYKRLVAFVAKHLNDKFYLNEEGIRTSARDIIARELCVNMLIHREYSNPYPARLIITRDEMITENANKPRLMGYIDISNFTPYPKNPKIAAFFKEIGFADELGSGIKKITKYAKIYSGGKPVFKEDDIFSAIVPLNKYSEYSTHQSSEEIRELVLYYIQNSDGVSRKEINNFIFPRIDCKKEKKDNKIKNCLAYLRKNNLIINIGTDTKPIWVMNDEIEN